MSGLYERHGKRLLDLAAIVVAAPVAAPLLAGIAAAVAATDGRPVLFRQARVGKDGREFTILKFRTMRVGTEHHGDGYWGAANDWRITPVGKILRSTSLDELPQLVNVLLGDMSLVGPRPKPREIVERYRSRYAETLRVRPGLTCLWAIHGRNELRRSQLIELDQEYVRDVSLLGDLRILVETIPVVLLRRGFFTEERSEGWMEDLEADPS
jgi:lipopolysaccharide/colanic/teichoic acid biosynthesis glycosyltransferase